MTRIAIITGAASGIGRALASALATTAATPWWWPASTARPPDASQVNLPRHGPGMAAAAAVDVRDAAAVHAVVHGTRDRCGRLDVIVNNAGIGVGGEAGELLLAHWDRVIDVNLRGVVHGVHAAYPVMIGQRSGRSSTLPRCPACCRRHG